MNAGRNRLGHFIIRKENNGAYRDIDICTIVGAGMKVIGVSYVLLNTAPFAEKN